MLNAIRRNIPLRIAVVLLPLLLFWVAVFSSGFAYDIGIVALSRLPGGTGGISSSTPEYYGPDSLEERIVAADVIARVRLRSVSQVVEAHEFYGETMYASVLEFTFDVLEYLKGSGGSEITAVAVDGDLAYKTRVAASMFEEDFLSARDTTFDDRDAIVFLSSVLPIQPKSHHDDRYSLGVLRFDGEDTYSIGSRHANNWLPSAVSDGVSGSSGSDGQQFLTGGVPVQIGISSGINGVSGASDSSVMTLASLKNRISEIDSEIDAGDGSEEYRVCVIDKYSWIREVHYRFDISRRHNPDLEFYERNDVEIRSGLSAGSDAFTERSAGFRVRVAEDYPNHPFSEFWLSGRDEGLFDYVHPGAVKLGRPLPEGEYRVYIHSRSPHFVICDAYPDLFRDSHEVFVHVTSPDDVVHEAFYDPVDIGTAVGADSADGVLDPASFSNGGGDTTIQRIEWDAGSVRMQLDPPIVLTDHHIDFIDLDGSVSLRLDYDDAVSVSDGGTEEVLTWGVCEQPWQSGDLLMLRISRSETGLTDTTNDADCAAAPDATPTPTPEPIPTATPTAEPTPAPDATLAPTASH